MAKATHVAGTLEFASGAVVSIATSFDVPRHRHAPIRSIGVADIVHALRGGRAHRASGELALHVLEVMVALQVSSDTGRHVSIETRPQRPAPLPASLPDGRLD